MLFPHGMDRDPNPVQRAVIGPVSGTENKSVMFLQDFTVLSGGGKGRRNENAKPQDSRDGDAPVSLPCLFHSLSSSSSSVSSSSSSSSYSSTGFSTRGLLVTTSKSVPHSGQEMISPSSSSSSSTSRSVSHSGQIAMYSSLRAAPGLARTT